MEKFQRFSGGDQTSAVDIRLLLEAIKDISYELDLKRLSEKIVTNVKALVNADKASLFFVCHNRKRLATFKFDPHTGIRYSTTNNSNDINSSNSKNNGDGGNKNFKTKTATVASSSTPQHPSSTLTNTSTSLDFEFEIPFDNTILGAVARSGNSINISNVAKVKKFTFNFKFIVGAAYPFYAVVSWIIMIVCHLNYTKDVRYDTTMDKMTGYQAKSLLCMPIKNANKEVIAVVQAINKIDLFKAHRDSSTRPPICFDEKDIRVCAFRRF